MTEAEMKHWQEKAERALALEQREAAEASGWKTDGTERVGHFIHPVEVPASVLLNLLGAAMASARVPGLEATVRNNAGEMQALRMRAETAESERDAARQEGTTLLDRAKESEETVEQLQVRVAELERERTRLWEAFGYKGQPDADLSELARALRESHAQQRGVAEKAEARVTAAETKAEEWKRLAEHLETESKSAFQRGYEKAGTDRDNAIACQPIAVVECPPCSKAGGADRGVFHEAPPCPPLTARTTSFPLVTEVVPPPVPACATCKAPLRPVPGDATRVFACSQHPRAGVVPLPTGKSAAPVLEQGTRETGGEGVRSTPLRDLSTGPGRKGGQSCPIRSPETSDPEAAPPSRLIPLPLPSTPPMAPPADEPCPPTMRQAFEQLKAEGVIPAGATDPHAGPMGSIGYVVTQACDWCGATDCGGNCQSLG